MTDEVAYNPPISQDEYTITFRGESAKRDLHMALHADDMAMVLWHLDQRLRGVVKHGIDPVLREVAGDVIEFAERLREDLNEDLAGIPFDE